jgi:hypothetical protein
MPTLEWIGKDKVINHHQEVSKMYRLSLMRFRPCPSAMNTSIYIPKHLRRNHLNCQKILKII